MGGGRVAGAAEGRARGTPPGYLRQIKQRGTSRPSPPRTARACEPQPQPHTRTHTPPPVFRRASGKEEKPEWRRLLASAKRCFARSWLHVLRALKGGSLANGHVFRVGSVFMANQASDSHVVHFITVRTVLPLRTPMQRTVVVRHQLFFFGANSTEKIV